MHTKRLELALQRLGPADWERFEKFASEFLASEFPELRTVAASSGDLGRDAQLFSPEDDPTQVLQYSVTTDWRTKLKKTAARLRETLPSVKVLIYVTNQAIGADADELKKELRKDFGLFVDIRSGSYFLERHRRDEHTTLAGEALAKEVVDPYLEEKGVLARSSSVLDTYETRAAHVYLSLQLRDDVQEKGLTKLSFEGLVRSVLINSDQDNRVPRQEVKDRIRRLLPNDPPARVDELTDSALSRLTKKHIRHHTQSDDFCLTFEETERVKEELARHELAEKELLDEIRSIVTVSSPRTLKADARIEAVVLRLRRILELCLFARAEEFVSAVTSGRMDAFAADHLGGIILRDLRDHPVEKGKPEGDPQWLTSVLKELISSEGEAIQSYLRDLANAYTLMAFLRATPEVQSAVQKIFSHGEIWLDTSAILPLLIEELIDETTGQFQRMLSIAREAGLRFYVIEGVAEEIERHINNCIRCSRQIARWRGPFPFLLEAFLQTGRAASEFPRWADKIRGASRPVDDVMEYLDERFRIERRDLEALALGAPKEVRNAVEEVWFAIHQSRRERVRGETEPIALGRLSKHDAENYVGVMQQRTQEKESALGYSAWWLTLDRAAHTVPGLVKQRFDVIIKHPPVLSIDFLAQYLAFGPARRKLSKAAAENVPVFIEPRLVRFLTPDLLGESTQIRTQMHGKPERLIRRSVRDHLDEARRRMGPLAKRGMDAVFDEIASFAVSSRNSPPKQKPVEARSRQQRSRQTPPSKQAPKR